MRAAQLTAPKQPTVVDAEPPQPGPGEVLIEVACAGICGTDIHLFHGEYEGVYPLVPGHEFSGTVAAVGEGVEHVAAGDRVTADPNINCGWCPACQRGWPNQCHHLQAIGVTRAGAFAEYVVAPQSNVFPIGDLSFEAAALVEPLACVVWGLQRVRVEPGDAALIFGAGPMGCLMLQAVKAAGAASVSIVDTVDWRLERAAELGASATVRADGELGTKLAELAPLGFDVVADVTGRPEVVADAAGYLRPRGTLWVFGVCPPGATASVVPYDIFRRDLSIVGSFAVCRTFPESIALLQSGAVRAEPLISHRLPLDDFAHGLDLAQHDPERMKVQFQLTR